MVRQVLWVGSQIGVGEQSSEPPHEIMVLIVLRKLILQTRMRSHPVGLDVWCFESLTFVYFHTSCVQTAKALARLRGCAGSPEPSLVAYVISIIISWAGSNMHPVKTQIAKSDQSLLVARKLPVPSMDTAMDNWSDCADAIGPLALAIVYF